MNFDALIRNNGSYCVLQCHIQTGITENLQQFFSKYFDKKYAKCIFEILVVGLILKITCIPFQQLFSKFNVQNSSAS